MRFANRTLVTAFVAILFMLGATTFAVSAAPLGLPPRPTPAPTPAPTAAPTPAPTPAPAAAAPAPSGGWIRARVANARAPQWVGVQWQDGAGTWQTVAGWRGQFDALANGVGEKTWWVDPALFGAGPFRWLVYEGESGRVVGQSSPFYLPHDAYQVVVAAVVIPPNPP